MNPLKLTIAVTLAAVLGSGALADEAAVYRGPYLQLATPNSMAVVWRTDGPIEPVLRYGAAPGELSTEIRGDQVRERVAADVAAEAAIPYERADVLYDEPFGIAQHRSPTDRNPSTRPGTRQFEVIVPGLSPATKYYYAIYDGERLLAGGDADHYFTTSPVAESPADMRVWVVGDSGTGGLDQRRVFDAMRNYTETSQTPVDLYLHVGDMAYGDGADEEFQTNFFAVYQPLLRNTVCWPAMGNHEGHTSRGISQFGPYYDAYVLPRHGEAGGAPSGTEAYYSFDIGRAHFVCLDSHDLDRSPSGVMAQWLLADLEQADADWLIAFWHHPPYTKGSHDSDRERQLIEMRTHIMPLLESAGVDLVLSGHSHIYERSMLIDGAYATPTVAEGVVLDDGDGRPDGDGPYRKSAGLKPNNGTIAIVAGHGGAGVSRKGTMPIMREIIVENGSLLLDIHGDTLIGTMIDKNAAELDQFQLVKRGVIEHQPLSDPWQPVHDPSQITEIRITWSEQDAGTSPQGWRVAGPASASLSIAKRPGSPYYQASLKSDDATTIAIYEPFSDPVSECEGYLELIGEAAGGIILGHVDDNNYDCYLLDAKTKKARFYRVTGGKRTLITERALDIDFTQPVKVEIEPVSSIIEVQINDALEYTINLPTPVGPGHLGVEVSRGQLNFAGVSVEKAKR